MKINRESWNWDYLWATYEIELSEQCRTRTSFRPPWLQSTTDRRTESILSPGLDQQLIEPGRDWNLVSRSKTKLSDGSWHPFIQVLQTNIGPVHLSSMLSREKMSRRHSWVNSVQSGPPSSHSITTLYVQQLRRGRR